MAPERFALYQLPFVLGLELVRNAAAVAEVSRLREALAESEEALHAAEDRLDERDHQVTVAVASEALRGIEMMERMEKNIEQRKDREAATLGKLKDAFRGASAQAARDEMASVMATKLAEVEAEAEERSHGRRPHRRRPQPRTSALRARAATRRYHGSTCTRTARLPRPPTAQPIPCLLALHGS